MNIEIWSDFACPFCYIGKKRFEAALNQFEHKEAVKVTYKAYQLNANAPIVMNGSAYEVFSKSHHMSIEEVKKRFKLISENAKTVGLTFSYDIIQMTNTLDAHRLQKWAYSLCYGEIMAETLFKAYFSLGINIADHQALAELSESIGLDKAEAIRVLSSDAFLYEVKQDQIEAKQLGVQGVPFFVINRKYGVSGAQDSTYFLQALKKIWAENQPYHGLKQDTSPYCEDDYCVR